MKIADEGDGVFRVALTEDDGSEKDIAFNVETVISLAKSLESYGITAADRAKGRGGNWRYCPAEKSLMLIRDCAETALRQIKLVDFPSDRSVQ